MYNRIMLSVLAAVFWAVKLDAVEVKLPFDAESLAAQAGRKCPGDIKVSGSNDVLTISISKPGKGDYEGSYSINARKGAGHSVGITIGVNTEKLTAANGKNAKNLGRIAFGNVSHQLVGGKSGWQDCSFKNVKIPGNGMLKLRITLRNAGGEVSFRNPRVNVNIPQRVIDKRKKNKKNKK